MEAELSINGNKPDIEGKILSELFCLEMWHEGILEEPANVIYIKVNESWYRHYFDCGIIFWRDEKNMPKAFDMDELNCSFKLINLKEKFNLNGLSITSIIAKPTSGGAQTEFTFSNGKSIIFANDNDITSYRT